MKIIPIHSDNGRDVYPDHGHSEKMRCACGRDIRFQRAGYNDGYFWNTVFAKPVESACECGIVHNVQWKTSGIEIEVKP